MQTIYNIDYLESISKEKLWNLAKKKTDFNTALMERKLKIPKNTLRFAIERSASKYDKKIKKYLIDFLSTGADLDLNLKELFKEANKYQKITNKKIAEDLGCDVTTVSASKMGKTKGKNAYLIKEYLENIINQYKPLEDNITHEEQKKEEILSTNYNINYLDNLTLTELFDLAKNEFGLTCAELERNLSIPEGVARYAIKAKNSKYRFDIKNYLVEFLLEKDLETRQEISDTTHEFDLKQLFDEAREHRLLTLTQIAEDLNCSISAVSFSIQGKSTGEISHKVRAYLKNIIEENEKEKEYDSIWEEIDKYEQEESKEQETMTEETLTDTKEMKTYDEFLNFINTQKELPIVKKALDESLSTNQNLEKILAKEEFITIETAQELNEKIFANEYTEAEILDFENQYYGAANGDSLKDKIKSFVEKHNLSLETALKLLQISEEDYKKMLEGADKVSNKTADKIYKAITAFDEFYHSEKTQDTINNTKNTFVTGVAIASAKGQTFLNKGLNKFADFLNKSAEKIKNSNSDNKEE